MKLLNNRLFRKNKIVVTLLMLLVSLTSVFVPHMFVEGHEHHELEGLVCHVVNTNKLVIRFRKMIKKLKALFIKLFRMPKILNFYFSKVNNFKAIFLIFSFQVLIRYLETILCPYFHGSKYRFVN